MTVCIAAIAKETESDGTRSDVLIMASDRMLTYRGQQYELRDQTKTFWFSETIGAMVAGTGDTLLNILQTSSILLGGQAPLMVYRVATTIAEQFRAYRQTTNEHRVLSKYGLTTQTFLQYQQQLDPTFLQRITLELNAPDADIGGAILLAGIDPLGTHLVQISDPGVLQPLNMGGFAAIGSGAPHADTVFMAEQYTHNRDWDSAMVLTYMAKKRAEVAPGVGYATDLYYVSRRTGRIYFEPMDPFQTVLENWYQTRLQLEKLQFSTARNAVMQYFRDLNASATPTATEATPDQPPAGSWVEGEQTADTQSQEPDESEQRDAEEDQDQPD